MRRVAAVLTVWCAASAWALQVGQTREEVMAELGRPQNIMTAGTREFLIYPGGRVEITAGRVSDIKGTPAMPGEPPAVKEPTPPMPPPGPAAEAAPVAVKAPVPTVPHQPVARWHTDIAEAQALAAKEKKLILALFTGTDWCGPCQVFKAEVENDPQFAGIFAGSFVFFKSDWLRNTPQPEAVKDEVGRLKRKYFVTAYPTLLVLNAEGERLDKVEWTKVREGSFKERMIEAIDIARKATKGGKNQSSWLWRFWPF